MPLVEREPDGQWTAAGAALANPEGLNQHTHPRAAVQRRIDLAIVREVERRPVCATTFAEKVCDALEDPEEHLEFLPPP